MKTYLTVYLSSALLAVLITPTFSRLMKKVGIHAPKGTGFYALRRTAATMAARSGDPFAVQGLLGHDKALLQVCTTKSILGKTSKNVLIKNVIQDTTGQKVKNLALKKMG